MRASDHVAAEEAGIEMETSKDVFRAHDIVDTERKLTEAKRLEAYHRKRANGCRQRLACLRRKEKS